MNISDPIGDMLVRIKNGAASKSKVVEVPYSKIKYALAQILTAENYLDSVQKIETGSKSKLRLVLKYNNGRPAITGLKRKSKPGMRWYVDKSSIPTVVGGMGLAIISTPKGLMTGTEAKKRGIGGELLCEVW